LVSPPLRNGLQGCFATLLKLPASVLVRLVVDQAHQKEEQKREGGRHRDVLGLRHHRRGNGDYTGIDRFRRWNTWARVASLWLNRVVSESTRMVGERGFEPPTPWSRTRCSTRLSHSPTCAADAYRGALPGAFIPLMRLDQCSRIQPPVDTCSSPDRVGFSL